MKIKHFYQIIILLTPIILISCSNRQKPDVTGINVFDIQRGVNISHWLSQSKVRGEQRKAHFTEKDVEEVAKAGFDHIRIPIDEEQMWDSSGNKETEAFALLHNALTWMHKYHLKAIVDLHIVRSHHFMDDDPLLFIDSGAQEEFAGLWIQLSEELARYPVQEVAYELLNESVASDHEDWNKVYRLAYTAVRNREPDRIIFIGPNRWQKSAYFPFLTIPENDPNIVLSFHFYTPPIITHYKASWHQVGDYEGPIHYPGVSINPQDTAQLPEDVRHTIRRFTTDYMGIDQLEDTMRFALQKRLDLGLQLYCGEFGCLNTVPAPIRNQWYADMFTLFEKHDIAWSAWDFKSNGFGVFDPRDYRLNIPRELMFSKDK
jgi:endoglucanase